MALSSMTGFARATGSDATGAWGWEAKSVNGRGLDLRCRLPASFDHVEPVARAAVAERFKRGNVSLTLTFDRTKEPRRYRINRALLDELLALGRGLEGRVAEGAPRLEGLLAVPGVVEAATESEDEEHTRQREQALAASLAQALDRLADSRLEEGAKLAQVVADRLTEIAGLTDRASASAAAQPAALRERLQKLLRLLLDAEPALPEERLAHEAALAATKADVSEELDRLRMHVAAMRALLTAPAPVGRQLDFLCQELNREANTLCSKATDMELTRIGLALKGAIEQLREQIQNVE
ncbi:MAG: YicC family protein [Alphaproteobacteria bacterium]|nr:YicC family protein [Alphaproteobacteria bacterium]